MNDKDTSIEYGYAVSRLEDGKEVFFEHKGISYGRGRSWTITPKQRAVWRLQSPLDLKNGEGKSNQHRTYRRRNRLTGMGELELLNTPEFLGRLQELLEARELNDLPDDAIVARCQVEPERPDLWRKRDEYPYETRNLNVLVLSNEYDVVKEGYRHPDLKNEE